MASRDPNSEESEAGVRPRHEGVRVEEIENSVRGAYRSTTFESSLITLFVSNKEAIALEIAAEKPTSLEKSRFLLSLASSYITYSTSTADISFSLPSAFLSMVTSALVATGSDATGVNFPPSTAKKCAAEEAFLAVLALMERQAEDPESYFENELEQTVFELFLSVKATVEEAAGDEVTSAEEEVQDLIRHTIEHDSDAGAFNRAFAALVVIVGFLAAEMSPRTSPDAISQAEANPFCFDLYLYMGFRYHLISREDYERLRSRMVKNPFSSKIGKAVILLSYAYRLKIMENFIGAMSYFKMNLSTCNSLYYITRFVRDSIQAYPTSSYRYLVLLSLISETTLAFYHGEGNRDSIRDYLNEACRYYNESGMIEFETRLQNHDNFIGVRIHADRLSKAWTTVSATAINAEALRPQSLTELLAQYGDRFQRYRLEPGSSRTSQADEDFEKEALRLDDEDVSSPDVDASLDLGRKSPSPEEAQLGPAVVEEIFNPEDQNDESPTKRSKYPVDVTGKSKPGGQKVDSPNKGCKGSADVKGKSKPEGRNGDSPTKGSKGPSPKGSPIVPSRLRDVSWNLAVSQSPRGDTLGGPAEVVSLVPEGQKAASSTKGSQRAADVKEQSKLEGQKAASPTKESQRPADFKEESKPKGQMVESPTKVSQHPVVVKEKSKPEDQKAASTTKGSQRPSPKAGKSSPGAQPKSEDVEEESITEPPENVPPSQGASQNKPKRKKSKGKR